PEHRLAASRNYSAASYTTKTRPSRHPVTNRPNPLPSPNSPAASSRLPPPASPLTIHRSPLTTSPSPFPTPHSRLPNHLIQIEYRQRDRKYDEQHHRADEENHGGAEDCGQCGHPAIEFALLLDGGFVEHAWQCAGAFTARDEAQGDRREQAAFAER